MKSSLLVMLILVLTVSVFAEDNNTGKLKELEKELNKPAENDPGSDDDHDCDDDDENFFSFLFRMLMYDLFIGVPGDQTARSEFLWSYGFNDYPYSPGDFGAYSIYSTKSVRLDLSTRYFYHNAELNGQNLQGNLYLTPFFNLAGSYLHLEEELKDEIDELDIYDIYFNYVRLRSEYFVWWWGLGVKHLRGDEQYTGFSLNTGLEIYFLRPLSVDLSFNNAFIYSQISNRINCNLKFHVYNFYLTVGYLREAAGSQAIPGITAGVGFNF